MLQIGGQVVPIVDCDVHEELHSPQDLLPYMREPWRRYFTECKFRGLQKGAYTETGGGGRRADTYPASGGPPGSDYPLMKQQLLDTYGIDYAILEGHFYRVSALPQSDFATALASAYNDWLADNWLSKDKRFKGSLQINIQDPAAAAREVDRMGEHPDMVQVVLSSVTAPGLGHPMYDPIWEAVCRRDLVVAVHLNNPTGILPPATPLGWPRTYIEWHAVATIAYQAQLANLVCEGVFEKFPKLKVVWVEGGFSWVPHLMWRLDLNWKSLRLEVPWLKRKPSAYILDHCAFTTQPIEVPEPYEHFQMTLDAIDGQRTVMFATDYPHWDFDSPVHALPRELGPEMRKRILGTNALAFYGLPQPDPSYVVTPGVAAATVA